jgi:hypothetical protein
MGFYPGPIVVEKSFSQACENNKGPILGILRTAYADVKRVLEVGSGTGQHAAFFARNMPWLCWQTSDLPQHHAGIHSWLEQGPNNALAPLTLDVISGPWPADRVDGMFTANTLHIFSWDAVQAFFWGAGEQILENGILCVYGPFNYDGHYTSESNANFDLWLRQRDPDSGVRDFEAVDQLAAAAGLKLMSDNPMPANNRLLCWRRR